MSVEEVKKYLKRWGKDVDVREFTVSSATVELAAKALNTEPRRIAKTISFQGPGFEEAKDNGLPLPVILVVTSGDAKVDNKLFKQRFGLKPKMLNAEEAVAGTGHPVGGVCPFAISNPAARVYLDLSLRRFASVFPASGSSNSCVEMTCVELEACSLAEAWVDVCKNWNEQDGT